MKIYFQSRFCLENCILVDNIFGNFLLTRVQKSILIKVNLMI